MGYTNDVNWAHGCPQPLYHPWQNCAKFGVAVNGGLAHFPGIPDKTLTTESKLEAFKSAVGFVASLDPQTLKLTHLNLTSYEATWEDVEFKLPELGVFSLQEEAIHTALANGFDTHFDNLIRFIVKSRLQSLLTDQMQTVNDNIDFTNMLRQ